MDNFQYQAFHCGITIMGLQLSKAICNGAIYSNQLWIDPGLRGSPVLGENLGCNQGAPKEMTSTSGNRQYIA